MMIIPRRKNNYDLFDSMFEDPLFERHEAKFMKTDIKEKGDKYFVDIDLPGYDKENIKIEIKNIMMVENICKKKDILENAQEVSILAKM